MTTYFGKSFYNVIILELWLGWFSCQDFKPFGYWDFPPKILSKIPNEASNFRQSKSKTVPCVFKFK